MDGQGANAFWREYHGELKCVYAMRLCSMTEIYISFGSQLCSPLSDE